jgi:hypothetical protein
MRSIISKYKKGSWHLPSNSGRAQIDGILRTITGETNDQVLHFTIVCRQEGYSKFIEGSTEEKYNLVLHDVPMSRRMLSENLAKLTSWLELPVDVALEFFRSDSESFCCFLKPSDAAISSITKPVFMMELSSFLTRIDVGFVIDQSCVRMLRDGLEQFL